MAENNKEKKQTNFVNDEKRKALDAALGQIEKQFGKGAVMKLRRKCKIKY